MGLKGGLLVNELRRSVGSDSRKGFKGVKVQSLMALG